MVNQLFARRIFGSVSNALGKYYKMEDGTRVQVVGVVEDGKYYMLTEDQRTAMFLPFLQLPTSLTCLVVRSTAIRRNWRQPSGVRCGAWMAPCL